jgi:hypothetical protein
VFEFGAPVTGLPRGTGPSVLNSYDTITADIVVPQGGGEDMIVTDCGRFGGFGMYLLKGKPVFVWNLLDLECVRREAPQTQSLGKHRIEYDFKYERLGFATLAFSNIGGPSRPSTGILKVGGQVVATNTLKKTVPLTFPWDKTFNVRSDTGKPVDDGDY